MRQAGETASAAVNAAFKDLVWDKRTRGLCPNPSHIEPADPTHSQNLIELLGLD